jgi:hypothetical protein
MIGHDPNWHDPNWQSRPEQSADSWRDALLEDDSGQVIFGAVLLELFLLVMGAPQSIPNDPFAAGSTVLVRTVALVYCAVTLREVNTKNALVILSIYAMLTWPPQVWALTLEARTSWFSGPVGAIGPLLLAVAVQSVAKLVPRWWWVPVLALCVGLFAPMFTPVFGLSGLNLLPQLLGETLPIWPGLALLITVLVSIIGHARNRKARNRNRRNQNKNEVHA